MSFELTNNQRIYFGLAPIDPSWERVSLKGDTYRPESIIYFEENTIKRHIISTANRYEEKQYNEQTREREYLLPVTSKGKEKKLTPSVLEARQPKGTYCYLDSHDRILIGNYDTQVTFYDSFGNSNPNSVTTIEQCASRFISEAPAHYIEEVEAFKNSKRKNIKFKQGDIFAFKINLVEYGFGRVLLDIDQLKKSGLISKEHGLSLIMGRPVLIKLYAYCSNSKNIDVAHLINQPSLPSDYIMDNKLFYGEYEIIGNSLLEAHEMDFPLSYGKHIDARRNSVFLQWGLINIELPFSSFHKYLDAPNELGPNSSTSQYMHNPYGYYGVGFSSIYSEDIKSTIANNGIFSYEKDTYQMSFDLRNPKNEAIKKEIMTAFGLDHRKSYDENCLLSNTINSRDLINHSGK